MFREDKQRQPIHTLKHVPCEIDSNVSNHAILAASMCGIQLWNPQRLESCEILHSLPGKCMNVSFDMTSQFSLASFRQSPSFSKPTHVVFELNFNWNSNTSQRITTEEFRTLHGTSTSKLMSRSLLFPFGSDRLLVAATDEGANQTDIWDVNLGKKVCNLDMEETPLDFVYFKENNQVFFGALSTCTLSLYKVGK